jgi:hypothetical protein
VRSGAAVRAFFSYLVLLFSLCFVLIWIELF